MTMQNNLFTGIVSRVNQRDSRDSGFLNLTEIPGIRGSHTLDLINSGVNDR